MTRKRIGALVAAAAAALWATVAFGQTTPADPLAPGAGADSGKVEAAPSSDATAPTDDNSKPAKPKHRESGLLTVTVHNDRLVGMVELRVGPAGSGDLKKAVGPLAFGRKTVIHLKRAKDCLYDVHAQFADEADTDQTSLDLCKDKNINLTD